MATTIQEIEQIDAIECLESGAIQVKRGTYYEKTVTETVPVMETIEVRTPVLDENGDPVTRAEPVMTEDDPPMPVTETKPVMVTRNVTDADGNAVLDDDGNPTTEEVAATDPEGNPLTEEVAVTRDVPVENVTTEERETGETREQETKTKSHVSNWRGVISLRDTARATELLGDKASVAEAHWASFPVAEAAEEAPVV